MKKFTLVIIKYFLVVITICLTLSACNPVSQEHLEDGSQRVEIIKEEKQDEYSLIKNNSLSLYL